MFSNVAYFNRVGEFEIERTLMSNHVVSPTRSYFAGRRQKKVAKERSGLAKVSFAQISVLLCFKCLRVIIFAASFLKLPDLKDPEAVQKFFLEEIQLGEEHLARG